MKCKECKYYESTGQELPLDTGGRSEANIAAAKEAEAEEMRG